MHGMVKSRVCRSTQALNTHHQAHIKVCPTSQKYQHTIHLNSHWMHTCANGTPVRLFRVKWIPQFITVYCTAIAQVLLVILKLVCWSPSVRTDRRKMRAVDIIGTEDCHFDCDFISGYWVCYDSPNPWFYLTFDLKQMCSTFGFAIVILKCQDNYHLRFLWDAPWRHCWHTYLLLYKAS